MLIFCSNFEECGPTVGNFNYIDSFGHWIWSGRIVMDREDCHFKFLNWSWVANVIRGQIEDSCSLETIT